MVCGVRWRERMDELRGTTSILVSLYSAPESQAPLLQWGGRAGREAGEQHACPLDDDGEATVTGKRARAHRKGESFFFYSFESAPLVRIRDPRG